MPHLIVLAGPNGSGKSTVAKALLPPTMPYLNADDIAKEMRASAGPNSVVAVEVGAGRALLERLDSLAASGADMAVETTLSGRALAVRTQRLRERGYQFSLHFLWLPSPDMAVARVAQRVRAGGHSIPENTIRRRWAAGLRLFYDLYQPLADEWFVFDNTTVHAPSVIAYGTTPQPELWRRMHEQYAEASAIIRRPDAIAVRTRPRPTLELSHIPIVLRSIRAGVFAALREHKRRGQSVVVWKDGQVTELPTDQIPDESETDPPA